MQKRFDLQPGVMRIRRQQTVEHPFGTVEALDWSQAFPQRTLGRVSAQMSLQVLAYKRVIKIFGTGALMKAIQT